MTEPQPAAPEDETLLQESDVPQPESEADPFTKPVSDDNGTIGWTHQTSWGVWIAACPQDIHPTHHMTEARAISRITASAANGGSR